MDRRERYDDLVEAIRTAMDGRLSEVWTALPGIIEAFNPVAMTVSVQPAVRGRITSPDGSERKVRMPLLVDVPVIFPAGGGFTMTFPIRSGDDALVVFATRCIDAWWQLGEVQDPLETRQHDLSDGFALVGPFSQPRVLSDVNTSNVQLRTDDGQAFVEIAPDLTIHAENPTAEMTMDPNGNLAARADSEISLRAPLIRLAADALSVTSREGGRATATIDCDIVQDGSITSTEDHQAGDISLIHHVHDGVDAGTDTTGEPQ